MVWSDEEKYSYQDHGICRIKEYINIYKIYKKDWHSDFGNCQPFYFISTFNTDLLVSTLNTDLIKFL